MDGRSAPQAKIFSALAEAAPLLCRMRQTSAQVDDRTVRTLRRRIHHADGRESLEAG